MGESSKQRRSGYSPSEGPYRGWSAWPDIGDEHNLQTVARTKTKPQLAQGASCCTPGGTRTPNLLIRSQTLYPIELRALGGEGGERRRSSRNRTRAPVAWNWLRRWPPSALRRRRGRRSSPWHLWAVRLPGAILSCPPMRESSRG